MARRVNEVRDYQVYVVPTIGTGPAALMAALLIGIPPEQPSGLASGALATAICSAIIVSMVATTALLLFAPHARLFLRLALVVADAGLLGAYTVFWLIISRAGTGPWTFPLLYLFIGLLVALAGAASTILAADPRGAEVSAAREAA